MTGRGAGFCAGYDVPGYMNPAYGRGFGWGRGWGRGFGRGRGMGFGHGWRHGYYATGLPGWARGHAYPYPYQAGFRAASGTATSSKAARTEELAYLKEQARYFTEALDDINKRIEELQKKAEKTPEK
ncbi:MAG: DUF5320 domain-containing protein [Candidatus Zixiibacteriota bacterium]